jgi:hypothetical protein
LWAGADRYYLVAEGPQMARLTTLLGTSLLRVKEAGGKFLLTNH